MVAEKASSVVLIYPVISTVAYLVEYATVLLLLFAMPNQGNISPTQSAWPIAARLQ